MWEQKQGKNKHLHSDADIHRIQHIFITMQILYMTKCLHFISRHIVLCFVFMKNLINERTDFHLLQKYI